MLKHRNEIDGLRAIAVIAVILFHAGLEIFSGGFVGVDIFFVISGYLITTILINDLETRNFSIIHFYEKRARRILPALFFVMFVCLPFAWYWLIPEYMEHFSISIIAVSFFVSNILFWKTTSYFDSATELKPLIHTWSLSVEEQFYVLFPLFLLFAWRLGKRVTLGLLFIVAVTSIGLAQWFINNSASSFPFYMLPTRAWELILGAFVAFYHAKRTTPKNDGYFTSEAAGLLGFGLIIYACFLFSEETPFPSFYTLAPTAGAALIILFSSDKTFVGKALAIKPLCWIGLISYSAYLWHQPLFAFARLSSSGEPKPTLLACLILICFALAYLTWRFVEQPFRNKTTFSRQQIFTYSLLATIFFIVIGYMGSHNVIKTKPQLDNSFLSKSPPVFQSPAYSDCSENFIGDVVCKKIGVGDKTVVVWGDSHGGVLSSTYPRIDGVSLYIITHGGCPPLIGVRRFDKTRNAKTCDRLSTLHSHADVIRSLQPSTVILVGRWTLYLHGWQKQGRLLTAAHHFLSNTDEESSMKDMLYRRTLFREQLTNTISYFAENSKVIVVTQPPDYASISFDQLLRSNFSSTLESAKKFHAEERQVYKELESNHDLYVVDTFAIFCREENCTTRDANGHLLYGDDNHLSPVGALMLWKKILSSPQLNLLNQSHFPAEQ